MSSHLGGQYILIWKLLVVMKVLAHVVQFLICKKVEMIKSVRSGRLIITRWLEPGIIARLACGCIDPLILGQNRVNI